MTPEERQAQSLARQFRLAVRRAATDESFARRLRSGLWTARSGARILEGGLLDEQSETPVRDQAAAMQRFLMQLSRALQGEVRGAS